jgi:hypothetical protein
MKKILFVMVIATMMIGFTTVVHAAPAVNVKKVFEAIQQNRDKLLLYHELEGGSFQAVYVAKGKRYTVYYSGSDVNFLSFWVRPNGTWSQDLIKTFTDNGLNGDVNFGIQAGVRNSEKKELFDQIGLGQDYRAYWQDQYDTAIADAMECFGL